MAARESELRSGGMRLWARFTLLMTAALAVVMAVAGFFLYSTTTRIASRSQEMALVKSLQLTGMQAEIDRAQAERDLLIAIDRLIPDPPGEAAGEEAPLRQALAGLRDSVRALRAEKEQRLSELKQRFAWESSGGTAQTLEGGRVLRTEVTYGSEGERRRAALYRLLDRPGSTTKRMDLLVPEHTVAEEGLLGLIAGVTILVILVAAGVSVFVANQVSGPLDEMIGDIRQISTGDLSHRTRAKGGGELALLARSIDRMTKGLAEARENELELEIRQREMAVAAEVREALLPQTTPTLEGYELGSMHLGSDELGGDFHDYVEIPGDPAGRVGLLVCDVSGKGLPGALVGATARSYLRAELAEGGDLAQALQAVNRELARDVRRGMFVTALYALVDPAEGIATVACAGHKIPLVRYTAADKKVRLIQPEGIALGFDRGPIFDSRLQVQQVPLEPGDRLVLANTGAVSVTGPDGAELGEKPLYALVMRHGGQPTPRFLAQLRAAFEHHAAGTPFPKDVSIVTIARA